MNEMMGYSGGLGMMNGLGMGFFGVLTVLFWVFAIAGIVWLVLTVAGRQGRADRGGALAILEERLARGEIDADEFRTRRAAIAEGSR